MKRVPRPSAGFSTTTESDPVPVRNVHSPIPEYYELDVRVTKGDIEIPPERRREILFSV